ncbi:MAG: glycoside hydrolase family 88 protein [Parabacteroides sp.]|nr:glycoside hydrolase family 88 protein [Parabacteroides sp.]
MTIFLDILAIIGFVSLLFLSIDVFILFNEWQQRIHIGRWSNRKEWQQAVERKAKDWLRHTPTVKITDQSRLILWDILRGNYRSKQIQSWQDAGLLLGLEKEDARNYVKAHPQLFKETSLEVDQTLLAYALIKHQVLTTEQGEYIKNLFHPYLNNEETVPYRKQLPKVRFVDTIGMIVPFLHACGYTSLATKQMEEFDKVLLEDIFPPHAFHQDTYTPMGVYDWSRGLGWYILGLIEADTLKGNKERILKLASSLLSFQQKDGGFSCMLFNEQERFESSGTALIGLLFIKAYQLSNEQIYLEVARATERALMKATRRNGVVDYAQGDTKGIGFYSRNFTAMPFAQGVTLYFSKQLDVYEKNLG